MAGEKVDLNAIFRMVSPYDFVGATALGSADSSSEKNLVRRVLKILYSAGSGGSAYSCVKMQEALDKELTNAEPEQKKELARVLSIISDNVWLVDDNNSWAYTALDRSGNGDGSPPTRQVTGIVDVLMSGKNSLVSPEKLQQKKFGLITVNSPFLGPQVRDAEKAELFINSIPTIVMSRCSPYVEMVFGFKRPSGVPLMTTGLLKFLLGGDQTKYDGATGAMISAETRVTGSAGEEVMFYDAGMEIFTSPQTLVNLDPAANANRYAPVLDPFRPLASLLSLTINVVSAGAGLYSYKKANAVIKLHDRSRLSEIADLVRPQVYTQTTVGITYGWRHPPEPGNPYAEFINENVLRKEAYGVQNASFAFDQDGGVTVNLELYMRGTHELNAISFEEVGGGVKNMLNRISDIAEKIRELRQDMNIDPPAGVSAEIRGMMVLDAASRGAAPELDKPEIVKAVNNLEISLTKNRVDPQAASELIASLKEMYQIDGKNVKPLQEQLKSCYSDVARGKFGTMQEVPDPFMPFAEKLKAKREKLGMGDVMFPFEEMQVLSKSNKIVKQTPQQRQRQLENAKKQPTMSGVLSGFVSFGTVYAAAVAPSVMIVPEIDEIQTFFYQLNDRAGLMRGMNIAEFPVELSELMDAYSEELERLGSNMMPLIGFITLLIRVSIDDMRSLGYGFRDYFKETKEDGKKVYVAKNEEEYANAQSSINGRLGSFQKPCVEVYAETLYEATDGQPIDQLQNEAIGRKILRIHIFDRTVNPYRAASQIVKSRTASGIDTYFDVNDEYIRRNFANEAEQLAGIKAQGTNIDEVFKTMRASNYVQTTQINRNVDGVPVPLTYDEIKRAVTRLVPTILYGSNASNVTQASLSSKQDPLLTAAQLTGLNKNKRNSMQANGASIGGLPLQIIPAAMNMTMLGCPLLNFGQFWFVDFNTGTTADNIYTLTGLVHSFAPGKFDSQITFSFYDAYGRYEGAPSTIKYLQAVGQQLETAEEHKSANAMIEKANRDAAAKHKRDLAAYQAAIKKK